jgi:hypothetical protein
LTVMRARLKFAKNLQWVSLRGLLHVQSMSQKFRYVCACKPTRKVGKLARDAKYPHRIVTGEQVF